MQRNFKELRIWQASMSLAQAVYEETNHFPVHERFGIINQMRRASVSIPSNIAEGCGRGSDAQLSHFLDVAQGSAFELETQILLSQSLGFLRQEGADVLLDKMNYVQRSICSFKNFLSTDKT